MRQLPFIQSPLRFTRQRRRYIYAALVCVLFAIYLVLTLSRATEARTYLRAYKETPVKTGQPLAPGRAETQDFTADGVFLQDVSLYFVPLNPDSGDKQKVQLEILDATGNVVHSQERTVTESPKNTFRRLIFHTEVALKKGARYTLRLSPANDSPAAFAPSFFPDGGEYPVEDDGETLASGFVFLDRASPALLWLLPLVLAALLLEVKAPLPRPARGVLKGGVVALCAVLVLAATELLNENSLGALLGENMLAAFLGLLWVLAAFALFFACTGSLPWAVRGGVLLVGLYAVVAYYVLQFRGSVLVPMDLLGVGTAMEVLGGYDLRPTFTLLSGLLLLVSAFFIAPKAHIARLPRSAKGVAARLAPLALAMVFAFGTAGRGFQLRHDLKPKFANQNLSTAAYGSLLNFVNNVVYLHIPAPEGYSAQAAADIAAAYPGGSVDDATQKPDIILILGESWADLTSGGAIQTSPPAMPFIQSFKERDDAVYGQLVVSVFGGGTSQTEFEILASANGAYGLNIAPFQFHVQGEMPSMASSLKSLGYETEAYHTGSVKSWGRDKAFPLLGFDGFAGGSAFENPTQLRQYMTDETMYNAVLSNLDKADAPQFAYLITVQTHGGYDNPQYTSPVTVEQPAGSYPLAGQYLGLMNESDAQLETFIAALEKRDRPTILLAFGDHYPNVEVDFLTAGYDPENPFAGYQTPFILWANYDLPDEVLAEAPRLSTGHLGAYLLHSAGLPLTGYQQFLLAQSKALPVASPHGFMAADGSFHPAADMPALPAATEEAILQYNMIFDQKHHPEGFYALEGAE